MAPTHVTWSAPRVASLSNSRIRLECAPETIRDVWKAQTKYECLAALIEHFAGAQWRAEQQAEELFDTTQRDGARLRAFGDHKRELVNRLGGFHGVEYLGMHRRTDKEVRYCNAGEPYAPTLCFMGRRLFVACWGDLVERRTVQKED